MGNDFALLFRFFFLFSFFVRYSLILCKKEKQQKTKLITDAIYFLFDQQIIWRWTGCVCVRSKSEWAGGVRSQSDREQAEPGSFFLFLSLSLLPGGQGSITECIANNNWLFLLLLLLLFFLNFGDLNTTCYLLCNLTFTKLSEQRFGKDPTQPESARSGSLAGAQRDSSAFISWSGRKTMTSIQQLLSNIVTFNRLVRGRGTITLSKVNTRKQQACLHCLKVRFKCFYWT